MKYLKLRLLDHWHPSCFTLRPMAPPPSWTPRWVPELWAGGGGGPYRKLVTVSKCNRSKEEAPPPTLMPHPQTSTSRLTEKKKSRRDKDNSSNCSLTVSPHYVSFRSALCPKVGERRLRNSIWQCCWGLCCPLMKCTRASAVYTNTCCKDPPAERSHSDRWHADCSHSFILEVSFFRACF